MLGTATVAGCGIANQRYSVAWTAALDSEPDAGCIGNALASMPEIFRTEVRHSPRGYVVDVYLKSPGETGAEAKERNAKLAAMLKAQGIGNYREWPDIYVIVGTGKGETFRMSYLGWPKASDQREVAAHLIVAKLAGSCQIPELAARAREEHVSEWSPYMFNI